MAENDQQDEYKFDEYDSNESMDNPDFGSSESELPTGDGPRPPKNDMRRNVIITVGVIIFIMLMYKIIGGLFFHKGANDAAKGVIPPAPVAQQMPPKPQPQIQPQVQPVQSEIAPQPIQPVVQEANNVLKQKVDAIEANQHNVQSQITSMNEQVGNVNNNVNNLTAQITKLNQTINDLTNQLSRQSEEINVLMQRTKPKPIKKVMIRRHGTANVYYINAVIPGRAWLIGTNGSTLTVREGTKISGYGVVKLIDSMEGRVITSSGRVIRFSQDDS